MAVDSKTKRAKMSQAKSFAVAFHGIWLLMCKERNFRFHLLASFLVIACCFFFEVEKSEWIAVFLLIGLVLAVEALNTAIEYICDLVMPEYHPMVKKIKDVAAAAVLLTAIVAIIIGCIIFLPYMLKLCI